jgi:hypothetical protein
MSDKRLIDGTALLADMNEYPFSGDVRHFYNEIQSGKYAIPSNQGEAARLREALKSLPEKIMNIDSIADDTLNFPLDNPTHEEQNEWFNEFCSRLSSHVQGLIDDELEALSSHTDDTANPYPSHECPICGSDLSYEKDGIECPNDNCNWTGAVDTGIQELECEECGCVLLCHCNQADGSVSDE